MDHTEGELLLTTEKLKKFEKIIETLDEILSNQRSPNDKTWLGYNDSLKTTKQEKEDENDETNTLEQVEQQDRRLEFRRNETSIRCSPIRYESNNPMPNVIILVTKHEIAEIWRKIILCQMSLYQLQHGKGKKFHTMKTVE